MKNTALAVTAVSLFAAAAQADFIVAFPGTHNFEGSHGISVPVSNVQGVLQGIRVVFTYDGAIGSSEAYDVAFTVNQSQWGGYYPFINGADVGERPTGAPSESDAITFSSGDLGMGYGINFDNQTAIVGFGNANLGGGCTITDVQITLIGVVPTPGAAGALALCGAVSLRRRRR